MFDIADVQGNILTGYRKARVRHLVLEVTDRAAARRWLTACTSGGDAVPQITTEAQRPDKKAGASRPRPETFFNIGLTFEGLRALGAPASSLQSFPAEFALGMGASAVKLGDTGASAPETWPAPFDDPARVHIVATIHADEVAQLDREQERALSGGKALKLLGMRDGCNLPEDVVHFGYRDNITQPRFVGVHDPDQYADGQPQAPLGTVLLGYPTNFEGLTWRIPDPEVLGRNGTFNAFRILEQDVQEFENYLDEAATTLLNHPRAEELLPPGAEDKIAERLSHYGPAREAMAASGGKLTRHGAMREVVAAHLCGRWRDGTPMALSPDLPGETQNLTDFDYDDNLGCPYGAHVRRCNPRGGQIVQRVANNSRRLVRRGRPYGAIFDRAKPDGQERGLLGNFIGASISAQFEAMSYDWLNVGLQDPRITGSNDPIAGASEAITGWFDMQLKSGATIQLRGMPRFVHTRGGAYTFLPSVSAIRHLGSLVN